MYDVKCLWLLFGSNGVMAHLRGPYVTQHTQQSMGWLGLNIAGHNHCGRGNICHQDAIATLTKVELVQHTALIFFILQQQTYSHDPDCREAN